MQTPARRRRLPLLLLLGLAATSGFVLAPLRRGARQSSVVMLTPAEERQNRANELRAKRVQLSRQAQESAARFYREMAAIDQDRNQRAAERKASSAYGLSAGDQQRAALEAMFSLSSEVVSVDTSVEAAASARLEARAKSEANQFESLLADLDLKIATLESDEAAIAAARKRGATADAAISTALSSGAQARVGLSESLMRAAELSMKQAVNATLCARTLVTEADAKVGLAQQAAQAAAAVAGAVEIGKSDGKSDGDDTAGSERNQARQRLSELEVTLAALRSEGVPLDSIRPVEKAMEELVLLLGSEEAGSDGEARAGSVCDEAEQQAGRDQDVAIARMAATRASEEAAAAAAQAAAAVAQAEVATREAATAIDAAAKANEEAAVAGSTPDDAVAQRLSSWREAVRLMKTTGEDAEGTAATLRSVLGSGYLPDEEDAGP